MKEDIFPHAIGASTARKQRKNVSGWNPHATHQQVRNKKEPQQAGQQEPFSADV
jgi:hypothetical protein